MTRGTKSDDEQGYTVTEVEAGHTVTGHTEVKSDVEHGYTVTGSTVGKNQKTNKGTQPPGKPW